MQPIENNLNLLLKNKELAQRVTKLLHKLASELAQRGKKPIKLMNFCGTHEWTTVHYGVRSLMPPNVELIAGPGCPVCITPSYCIENAIKLALDGITVYTFGDAYKLPAMRQVQGTRNLAEAKAQGGDVKVVYSFLDAVKHVRVSGRESVFLAIGFETTAPSYALPLSRGAVPDNLKLLTALRLTPPAARHAILTITEHGLDPVSGIIAPGHVSAVIGAGPWDQLAKDLRLPAVVSGFEPIDLLISISVLLKMILNKVSGARIEYTRVVSWNGNMLAKKLIENVFEVVDSHWRGLGFIPSSGLELKTFYKVYDAYDAYGLKKVEEKKNMHNGCRCPEVIMGLAKPVDCPLFMRACTPLKPYGPCMVSSEGTCAIWARFGGGGLADRVAETLESSS
ncbi:MAG: hydrogenase formation protein HypD [Thermofilaceae archaeon]